MSEINSSANSSSAHQNPSDGEVSIDILKKYWEPKPECCIYKVPIDLRKKNEDAYTPQVISIGPIHHNKKELFAMEIQKKRHKYIFEERKGVEKLGEMETYIKKQNQRILDCYERWCRPCSCKESFESCKCYGEPPTSKFVDIILNDAVFIIELFLRYYWQVDDFLLGNPRYRNTIKRDLQLLENQLPYFVLEELYKVGTYHYEGSKNPSFFQISCKFFGYDDSLMDRFSNSKKDKHLIHFTDLKRCSLIENHPKAEKKEKVEGLPCATKLHKSGVRFTCVKDKDHCLLDLNFETNKRGILPFFKVYELQIPAFKVNDWTEVLIRNVMALEQCHCPNETHVCNYISLMDFLINTETDADLLIDKRIIVNCLGENAAIAKMFNEFCLQTSLSPSCYYDMATALKRHYESPYHHAKATFKSVYFSNPWKGT